MLTTNQPISNYTTAEILNDVTQYVELLKACSATSAISMLCSLLIVVAYIHLRISQPDKADRVSLRCVFMASIMNLINSVFGIVIISIYGDTYLCRASSIIVMFTRVMSAVFLALVGVNLVLVFVCNVSSSAHRLERIYYPSAIVYGLMAITVPIIESSDDALSSRTDLQCYYFLHYYQFLGHSSMLWMWFYGFLFLTVVVAVVCSITALIKLTLERHTLIGKWIPIALMSQTADSTQSNIEHRIKSQTNIFMRVISRCVLYPLVPLISNILGFIFQIYLINPHNGVPNFAFSLTEAIFKCLQGFFVAIIFFSDPAMTHYMSEQWSLCKKIYIDEFSKIHKYSNGQLEVMSLDNKSNRKSKFTSHSSSITIMPSSSHHMPSVITPLTPVHRNWIAQLVTDNKSLNIDWENMGKCISHDSVPFNTIPMRRLSVPASVYTQIHHNDTTIVPLSAPLPQSSLSSSSTAVDSETPSHRASQCIADSQSDHCILVPYKHPRLASAFHWFLMHCGFKRKEPNSSIISSSYQSHQLTSIFDTSIADIAPCIRPLNQCNSRS